MEKENGDASVADGLGGGGSSKGDASSLLDAASLFGAYWGRDANSQAAAASLLGAGAGGFPGGAAGAMSGFGLLGAPGGGSGSGSSGGRYPPTSTMSIAASQAASLGLHPAASAAWWSMASQLAAQDYLARLQASGLAAFPPDPYAAALGALGGGSVAAASGGGGSRSGSSRSQRAPRSSSHRSHKDKNSSSSSLQNQGMSNSIRSPYGLPKTSSPSLSNAQSLSMSSSLSALGLNSLAGSHGKATTHPSPSSSSSSKHRKSSSSAAAKASALSGAYLAQSAGGSGSVKGSSGSSLKDKELAMLRGDLIMAQAAMAQNAYQAAVAAASHKGGKSSMNDFINSSIYNNPFGLTSTANSGSSDKHSGIDSIPNLPHTILSDNSSILGGVRLPPDTEIIKYTSSIGGPKAPGSNTRGRKKTISLDPPHVSVLPALSSTGLLVERGGPAKRPKLDAEYGHLQSAHNSSNHSLLNANSSSDKVEVIKLPSGGSQNSSPFSMSSYTGLSKELLQSIANQSGLNLAALEKQFAEQFGASTTSYKSSLGGYNNSLSSATNDIGLNLSSKSASSRLSATDLSQRDLSPASTNNDEDGPLNLCVKPSSRNDWKNGVERSSKTPDDSLSSLSNITANLGNKSLPIPPERISRRKPGAKPRRVIQDINAPSSGSPQRNSSSSPSLAHHRDRDGLGGISGLAHLLGNPATSESPGPKSSGSEDNDIGPWHSGKEGRPRNLGRGVSKPKKNTVASLLAQSRALGIRPALAHQYLQEAADLLNPELQEKLKAAMNDPNSVVEMSESESEGPWESCPSDTEDPYGSRSRRSSDYGHLRIPISLGWKRETIMKGLSRTGSIKGDVIYYPPEPNSTMKIKSSQELAMYLESNPSSQLTKDNFSFSSKPLIGTFLQINPAFGLSSSEPEIIKMSETEVAKRLEEARRALGSMGGATLAVEQRIELARQQQAAREARKDAVKGREQARLVREQERSEKAEQAKRDREARNQQLLEDQKWLPSKLVEPKDFKSPKSTRGSFVSVQPSSETSSVCLPTMNITLTALPFSSSGTSSVCEYNALDKIVNFAESAALDLGFVGKSIGPAAKIEKANSVNAKVPKAEIDTEALLQKLIDTYSRMREYVSGQCDWTESSSKFVAKLKKNRKLSLIDLTELECEYLASKNSYMLENVRLVAVSNSHRSICSSYGQTEEIVDVIDLVDDADGEFMNICSPGTSKKKISDKSVTVANYPRLPQSAKINRSREQDPARRKRQEELEKQRHEDQTRKQQERELKRQQAVMLKEQMYIAEMNKRREVMFTVELERERRRQHMTLVKQLDGRRRYEDREKRKHRLLLDRLLSKEKRLEERKKELELLTELRKPQEDSTLSDQKALPKYGRIPGLKLPGQAMADILMVFEFLHNFGQTLGFDMETLPSLNTLQMALLPDCCTDSEEELISVLTHLLACAIEDPGIPHPGRHTTILGTTLRTNEITPANISEICRIYLYATATGEVKTLTGIYPERDREKRVADHFTNDSEALQYSCHGKNAQYYRHLHSRPSWKLAEHLRLRPFAALEPTTKAGILAKICDNLLSSKQIIKQIDASIENLGQLKKDRYLMECKVRKVKMMHSRKVRIENAERQQAIALERMQRMVEDSEMNQQQKERSMADKENDTSGLELNNESKSESFFNDSSNALPDKKPLEEAPASIENGLVHDDKLPNDNETTTTNHNDREHSPDLQVDSATTVMGAPNSFAKEKDKDHLIIGKTTNGTSSICAHAKDLHLTDKDSVVGDGELILSDIESEGTQPEECEDLNLTAEELGKKLDKLVKQSDVQLQTLIDGAHSLRATCFGQDRYWRRYWSLRKAGGVFVEGMESAQPEIMSYHERLEATASQKKTTTENGCKSEKGKCSQGGQKDESDIEGERRSALELKNIKSELNLSDHTRIIKYEPNLQAGHGKVEGSPIKMEEKFIQQQNIGEHNLLDIEDSIPTAFLVQKPISNKAPSISNLTEIENVDKRDKADKNEATLSSPMETDKVDNQGKIKEEEKDASNMENNNLDLPKEEKVLPKEEKETDEKQDKKPIIKDETIEIKDDTDTSDQATILLNTKINEGKWFSILRSEIPLVVDPIGRERDLLLERDINNFKTAEGIVTSCVGSMLMDADYNCSDIMLTQGNKWDVTNNLHFLKDANALLSNMSNAPHHYHHIPIALTNFYHPDSSLTMSGLDQDMLDASAENAILPEMEVDRDEQSKEDICSDESKDNKKAESEDADTRNNKFNTIGYTANCAQSQFPNINIATITSYVTCDSPAPLQLTPDETEQLEYCKIKGLPKKIEGNFVPKDIRHGWWRITENEQLEEVLGKLHPRGVRERELQNTFLLSFQQTNNRIQIENGDHLATELSVSHLDFISEGDTFAEPDFIGTFSEKTCRRIEIALLEQIESLEDKVAAASMQIKGWKPGTQEDEDFEKALGPHGECAVELARTRILNLEAAIERRYLRPPLGAGAPPAPANANTSMASPPTGANSNDLYQCGMGESAGDSRPNSPVHNHSDSFNDSRDARAVGVPRGLVAWREAAARSQTTSQLAMVLHALESAIAWDKSIMKANCQFCQSGDSEDKLLLCDGCDKGYHTYCFRPKMDKIPEGDWYCFECVNKSTGDKVCIVCGGRMISQGGQMVPVARGKLVPCALCPKAYHQDCHYPPMTKAPRGKWYCINCIQKAPPKKPRNPKKPNKNSPNDSMDNQPPSPAPSHASTATTTDDCPMNASLFCQSSLSSVQSTPEKHFQSQQTQCGSTPDAKSLSIMNNMDAATSPENGNIVEAPAKPIVELDTSFGETNDQSAENNHKESQEKVVEESNDKGCEEEAETTADDVANSNCKEEEQSVDANNDVEMSENAVESNESKCSGSNGEEFVTKTSSKHQDKESPDDSPSPARDSKQSNKKDRSASKRLTKELAPCKQLLEEMELHDDSWPFLLPVNTKQFPTYKKVIRSPMDLSTIKKKLQDLSYKSKEEFACDVRQIFHNCEVFNEDESPVGQAGHGMRKFFEERWNSV